MPRADARRRTAALLAAVALVGSACSGGGSDEALDPPSTTEAPDGSAAPAPTSPEPSIPPVADVPVPAPTLPPPTTEVPSTRPALQARLAALLETAAEVAPTLELGVLVVDEAGREVVALGADQPALPASTLKLVTAAAALTTLGPDATLRTVVDATAGIAADGTLDGDLVLVGTGDPTLVTEEYARFVYPSRPSTPLPALADQLVAGGLRRVTGHVRGTAPGFGPPALPSGWREAYLDSLDGRYVAGLTVDGGLVTRLELPDVDTDEPPADGEAADTDTDPADDDGPLPSVLDQLARLDTDQQPTLRTRLTDDPLHHTARELTRLLRERGVEVARDPTSQPPPDPVVARLATVTSPPLDELLRFAVQRSDNHLADALAIVTARVRTGEGSVARVHRAFTQVLERIGAPSAGAAFADGSGLSRDDRVTPRLLTELDRRLTGADRYGGTWRSLHAVAGESGTLRRRLVGTAASGRLLAKTGTLRDVSALAGQVVAADADRSAPAGATERRYHLAVLATDADAVGRAVARAAADELVLALTADLDGCDLAPAGDVDGPLGRPPSQVRCPTG